MFWCILLTQRTSTALPMPWSLHLFIALQLSSFPQHCNHSTKNHVSVFWSIFWGQQGGQLGGRRVKSASKCKTKCHCRNICKKGRPGVGPGWTPGWTPGKKIDKICEKIITETSAKKHAWKNAARLHGGPPTNPQKRCFVYTIPPFLEMALGPQK